MKFEPLPLQKIARNVQQASRDTQDVNANIENVNKAAGETGTAAGQVQAALRGGPFFMGRVALGGAGSITPARILGTPGSE